MSFKRIFRLIVGPALISGSVFISCERELDLALFEDDFGDYEPEVRIEAVITPYPFNSNKFIWQYTVVVRVDNSITVDDTTIYNGRDDNGNWRSYTDENGNGQWDEGEPLNDDLGADGMIGQTSGFPVRDEGEGNGKPDYGEPNVDEYDEILPLIHDTTAVVTLTNLTQEKAYSLIWQDIVAGFYYLGNNYTDPIANNYIGHYGGYIPDGWTVNYWRDADNVYEFSINLPNRNLIVTGQTQLIPPADFLNTGYNKVCDTLYIPYGSPGGIIWQSDPRSTVYCVRAEIMAGGPYKLFYEHPNFANQALTAANGGIPVGYEPISSELTPGLYRLVVITMDENYSRYYYSSLPLKDPQKSNLRDQHGNVVMGVAGSKAESEIYIRITAENGDQ